MRFTAIVVLLLSVLGLASAEASSARVGLQLSFGTEQANLFGSGQSDRTQILMFQPQLAVGMSDAQRPRLEIVTELTIAQSLRPESRFILALSAGPRFHLRPTKEFGGYLELGVGIGSSALHTNHNRGENRNAADFDKLDGWLQYHLQIGGGIRIELGNGEILLGYRLTHFSNNGTQLPNRGLNLNTIVISYQIRLF